MCAGRDHASGDPERGGLSRAPANARRDELVGIREGVLVVCVAAPALDGRANRAIWRVLGKRLALAPTQVTIVRGQRLRHKLVQVEGVDQAALDAALCP